MLRTATRTALIVPLIVACVLGQTRNESEQSLAPDRIRIVEPKGAINNIKQLGTHEPLLAIEDPPEIQAMPPLLLPGETLKTTFEWDGQVQVIVTSTKSMVPRGKSPEISPRISSSHDLTAGGLPSKREKSKPVNLPGRAMLVDQSPTPLREQEQRLNSATFQTHKDPMPPQTAIDATDADPCPPDPPVASVRGVQQRFLRPERVGDLAIVPGRFVEFTANDGKSERLYLDYTHCSYYQCILGGRGRTSMAITVDRPTQCFWARPGVEASLPMKEISPSSHIQWTINWTTGNGHVKESADLDSASIR